jgi:hypothetical protein
MSSPRKEILLDERRRTSFARVGSRAHSRYLVEEHEDGSILLSPAVTISETELNLLRNPAFHAAMETAAKELPTAGRRRPERALRK